MTCEDSHANSKHCCYVLSTTLATAGKDYEISRAAPSIFEVNRLLILQNIKSLPEYSRKLRNIKNCNIKPRFSQKLQNVKSCPEYSQTKQIINHNKTIRDHPTSEFLKTTYWSRFCKLEPSKTWICTYRKMNLVPYSYCVEYKTFFCSSLDFRRKIRHLRS